MFDFHVGSTSKLHRKALIKSWLEYVTIRAEISKHKIEAEVSVSLSNKFKHYADSTLK